ncbi:MAG: enoyl-CoA hydratase-related protein [Woeseiaceae bacterium]
MEFETLLYDVKDEILTITLNRPDRLNAWNRQMLSDMLAAFDAADADDDVGAVVITGAGRGFCAGADLSGGGGSTFKGAGNQPDLDELGDSGGAASRRIFRCLKPVIVAFNGPAVGVGLTMTLAADVRLAAPNIKMGFVFAARGIISEGCSSYFLPRLVGVSKALEWAMTARVFRSEEALEAGLVRSIHEPEDLLPAAYELAREFAANSRVSNAVIRQMFWRMLGADDPVVAHRLDTKGMVERGRSADATEGTTAFLEKRAANFPDKVSKDMPDFFPWWEEPTFLE